MHSLPSAPHPLAFASLPWQLVLAIIVFNIVAGMISKRKQKQSKPGSKADPQAEARKAEAMRDKENARNREIERSAEETRLREAAEAKRKAAERQAREEMLRARVEARKSREAAAAETPGPGPAPDSDATAQTRRETVKSAGRGLLDQLARELGLELPEPSQPFPVPSRPTSRPVPAQPARPQGARPGNRGDARGEDADDRAGLASRAAPVAATVPPVPASPAQTIGLGDFDDPEAMRKAFVLKTLLDKPLALRPRR